MRPLLIGIHNSFQVEHRLWRLLFARTGATMDDYLKTFEWRGLVRGEYDPVHARIYAHEVVNQIRDSGRTVILFGDPVREAFNHALNNQLPPVLLHPVVTGGCTWRRVPHVLSAWYEFEENRILVEMLFEELYVKHNERHLSDVTE